MTGEKDAKIPKNALMKTVKTSNQPNLNTHSNEELKRYCNFCDYQTSWDFGLKVHVELVHKRDINQFNCDSCAFKSKTGSGLKRHTSEVHNRSNLLKIICSICDFMTSRKDKLKRHIQVAHEGIRYKCDGCDYQATRKEHLTRHFNNFHKKTIKKET